MKLSSSKNTQVILLVLLVVALLFAVYYYLVLPKQSEVDSLNRSVSSLENEVSTLETSIKEKGTITANASENLFALGKKVPQSREIDKLLLNIEEIQYVTDSIVMSMNFSDYDSSAEDANIGIHIPNEDGETTTEDPNVSKETVNESPLASLGGTLPPELKLITFNLEVLSPDYNKLLQFIDELESLERIMHVDAISYSLPGEEAEFDEEALNNVTAMIQVTTFYYEGQK
ncbi:potassium transporter [Ureibacillus acetophenoni]|uniref:Type IV pilus assembly protein PilO n=1 Tax=Ureibacillus acetophenoni TaxID=614649 RepID=A0A285U940_9BACL|nr:potassium transporter [Ureibacillus acetophenoni]SOC38253.1 hypothetical protein SAMN05877842_10471 [Ureibacillus acetophenoni]